MVRFSNCKRKIISCFIFFISISLFFAFFSTNVYASTNTKENDNSTTAYSSLSYIVFETETMQTLYRQNTEMTADCSLLARLMVCLLVYENNEILINDYISPANDSISTSGRYSLYASKQYMVDHLLKDVILCNADNAAAALADAINPSREYVVMLMNQKAMELGMNNTYFTNVDGAYDSLQRTTVYDMSVFWSYAMSNTLFKNVASSTATNIWDGTVVINECTFIASESFPEAEITSGTSFVYDETNNLSTILFSYTGKFSDTTPAVKLVMVVSGIEDTKAFLLGKNAINDITDNFVKTALIRKGDYITAEKVGNSNLNLLAAETYYCMMPINTENYIQNVSYVYNNPSSSSNITNTGLIAPIEEGSIVGSANYLLKDGSTHTVNLIAGNSIHSDSRAVNYFYKLIQENTDIFILISVLLILDLILFISFIIYIIKKKIKR